MAVLGLVASFLTPALAADDWFQDDVRARTAEVNEGELRFLAQPPEQAVHHHHNVLTIDAESLQDGWVSMQQCHRNLDAVPRAQIVFREGHIRNLAVTDSESIGTAWVEDDSIQLAQVRPGARLCLDAESLVLRVNEDGTVSVRNGPFMRRFLDGYYPMQVSMDVRYPCDALALDAVSPSAQAGFEVSRDGCQVMLDAWFEGQLYTEIRFQTLP